MSLQGTIASKPAGDRRLALVEIAAALSALHRRFYARLRMPTRPTRRKGVLVAEGNDVDYRVGVKRIEILRERSIALSGCNHLSELGQTLSRYRSFVDKLFDGEAVNGDVFAAADSIRRDVHELCSIHRISGAFPESAASRARKIGAKR